MRYLILSDIHSNLEALAAVVKHAEGTYDRVVCLGDVVGYGADPNAVTDWMRENCAVTIRGNHDKACCGLEEPALFNPVARAAVVWTFDELSEQNRKYLRELPAGPVDVTDFVIVHGSILDEDEYVLDVRDATPQFERAMGRLVLFGHTHVQGGFFLRTVNGTGPTSPSAPVSSPTPASPPAAITLRDGDTMLINPGSVGQPRDRVWESGYALYDSDARRLEYRRCPYDVARAQQKIVDAGLPAALAERLVMGR